MLAVMAQPHLDTPPAVTPATMSVSILPSAPVPYSRPALQPSPAKRPKLSLNTSDSTTVFGKKSTSLRWDTLSATSPTSLNTFGNGYHHPQQPSSPRSPRSPRNPASKRPRPRLKPLTTILTTPIPIQRPASSQSDSHDSDSTSSSATSASTIESLSGAIPYKVSYTVPSILANGPYPRPSRITKSQPRRMFPTSKRVSFRAPLTEDVVTTKYTMAHSDIQSSVSTISTLDLSTVDATKAEDSNTEDTQVSDTTVVASPDEMDEDTCPETPVAGRRKRERLWRWTLGKSESDDGEADDAEEEHDHDTSDEQSSEAK